MEEGTTYVGMDVHKRTIAVSLIPRKREDRIKTDRAIQSGL